MGGDDGRVERLLRFEVDDPGVPLGFRARLARENGWSPGFAARVFDEYRRFLVLATTTGQAATPSDAVDQAWHLHLAYTRSYWDDLCGTVLGRPLHHGPTTGTSDDGELFRAQYQATLDRYLEVFGQRPPADIWPEVEERFRQPARWQRVDTRANVVVRRAPLVASAAAGLLIVGLTAAADSEGSGGFSVIEIGFLVFLAISVIGYGVASYVGRGGRRRGGGGHGGCGGGGDSGCGGSGCGGSGCGGGGCGGD